MNCDNGFNESVVRGQGGGEMSNSVFAFSWMKSGGMDTGTAIVLLIGLILCVTIFIGINMLYAHLRKVQRLEAKAGMLDLGDKEVAWVMKLSRAYKVKEPAKILCSMRLFDELAAKEIERILSTEGSNNNKDQTIHRIYEIRDKLFRPAFVVERNLKPVVAHTMRRPLAKAA